MGKPTGFLEYERKNNKAVEPLERIKRMQACVSLTGNNETYGEPYSIEIQNVVINKPITN